MKFSELFISCRTAKTKKYLEIIPANSFDRKPNEKSMLLLNLSTPVAELQI